jgi:hypothetical protein
VSVICVSFGYPFTKKPTNLPDKWLINLIGYPLIRNGTVFGGQVKGSTTFSGDSQKDSAVLKKAKNFGEAVFFAIRIEVK